MPGGTGARGAQVGVVAELLGGQRVAQRGLEVDGVQLRTRIVDHRGQVGTGGAIVTHTGGNASCRVVDLGGGVTLPAGSRAGGGRGWLVGIVEAILCQVAGQVGGDQPAAGQGAELQLFG